MADEKSEEDAQHERRKPLRRSTRQHHPAKDENLLKMIAAMTDSDSEEDSDFEVNEIDEVEESGSEDDDIQPQPEVGGIVTNQEELASEPDSETDQEEEVDQVAETSEVKLDNVIDIMRQKIKEGLKEPASPTSSLDSQSITTESVTSIRPKTQTLDVLICGICLDDECDEEDEIIECDNCGITVHEGCYGVCDEESSVESSDTDSPTEPWFCDCCRAGLLPDCELCPNEGGIFKETDTGQWVHLACALYTSGVAFINPEKLDSVTLSEIAPTKWGAKECILCEDSRFSRTGVCTGCDAGLCKSHFHVICAQKNGLLSEVPEDKDEPDVADPLYAHCKAHIDKNLAKKRRRNWLAFESHFKNFSSRHKNVDRSRVEDCLKLAQSKYYEDKAQRPTPYTPSDKIPRLLSTCPSACRQLFKKAELLGFTSEQTHNVLENLSNVRRKWYIQPALTVDFVNYFHDRDSRMEVMQSRQTELETNNKMLQAQEQVLREKFEDLTKSVGKLTNTVESLKDNSKTLHNILCKLAEKELPLPALLAPRKKQKKQEQKEQVMALHVCSTCKRTENQHLLAECDTCHNFYHLGCVDPPLTRMPKKSGKCLWQCSECDSSDTEEEEMEVDPDDDTPNIANRKRRTIKQPVKFTPLTTPVKEDADKKPEKIEKRGAKRKHIKKEETPPVVVKRETKTRQYGKKAKLEEQFNNCATCKESGLKNNMVKCDDCQQCYHFGCLDPPVKNNPKQRGYSWICTNCDVSEAESEGSDQEESTTVETQDKQERKSKERRTTPTQKTQSTQEDPPEVIDLDKILEELKDRGETAAKINSEKNEKKAATLIKETIVIKEDTKSCEMAENGETSPNPPSNNPDSTPSSVESTELPEPKQDLLEEVVETPAAVVNGHS